VSTPAQEGFDWCLLLLVAMVVVVGWAGWRIIRNPVRFWPQLAGMPAPVLRAMRSFGITFLAMAGTGIVLLVSNADTPVALGLAISCTLMVGSLVWVGLVHAFLPPGTPGVSRGEAIFTMLVCLGGAAAFGYLAWMVWMGALCGFE